MRDKFIKEGMSEKEAKAKAAKLYNDKHKKNPVKDDEKKEKAHEENSYGKFAKKLK